MERLGDYLTDANAKVWEGARSRAKIKFTKAGKQETFLLPMQHSVILRDESRVLQAKERWIVDKETNSYLLVHNRFDKTTLKVPIDCVLPALRRLGELIDVTGEEDYLLCQQFQGVSAFFPDDTEKSLKALRVYERYLKKRKCNLILPFRFDISAPGTRILAYYAKTPIVASGVMWNVAGIEGDDAKIVALWMNSTLALLQMFLDRAETRGAFMELHMYVLEDLLIPKSLSAKNRTMLLELFAEVSRKKRASILEQLKEHDPVRKKIDGAFMKVLGLTESEAEEFILRAYPMLHDEILKLKVMMQAG